MNSSTPQNAAAICSYCVNIGRTLQNVEITQNALEAVDLLESSPKMRIALVASSYSNAQDAIAEILGQDIVCAIPSIDKMKSSVIHFEYGSSVLTEDVSKEDTVTSVHLSAPADVLEKMEMRVYTSLNGFGDFNWKNEISAVDFVFMTVSASQLFTQSERGFLQNCVKKYIGAPRFALILADTDAIKSDEDYNAIKGAVNWNLSSAGMSQTVYELGAQTLNKFVCDELVQNAVALHQFSVEQIAVVCRDETNAVLQKLLTEADTNIEDLVSALEGLKKRAGDMTVKGDIAGSLAYSDISGGLTLNATQSVHSYFTQLNEEVTKTLEGSNDINATVELLPNYLSSSIESFNQNLQKLLKADAEALADKISERMNDDASEFLGTAADVSAFSAGTLWNAASSAQIKEQVERDLAAAGNHTEQMVEKLSKALLIGTVPAFLITGFLGAAGTFIVSRKLKDWMKNRIALEDKKNAVEVAHQFIFDIESEMTISVKSGLLDFAAAAEKKVKDAYSNFVAAIMAAVQAKITEIEKAKENRSQTEEMVNILMEL